jgi:enoyl-CoA hydratase/carnithine racemase
MGDLLVSEVGDGIATLTLDRPAKRNALSIALRDEVSDALDALADDPELKVVVVTGSGAVFSAGFDLSEFSTDEPGFQERLWASSDRFHHAVLRFPLPTIAAVNGPALAGGFDLAMLCDIRIASDAARFAHPEQAWADVVYSPLARAVGGTVANDLAMTGRSIDAAEALALGVVSQVHELDQFAVAVAATAMQVAQAPRDVLLRTKAKALARAGLPSTTTPTLDL